MGVLSSALKDLAPPVDAEQDSRATLPDVFSQGLRSGGLGMMSGLNNLAGGIGQAVGANDFARGRFMAADDYGQRAAEAGPRVGRFSDVHGLRDFVDYAAGLGGQMVPMAATALGATALTGGGVVPAMLAGTAAMAPTEVGDVIGRQRAEGDGQIDLGRAAATGIGSAALQNIVPAVARARLAGSIGRVPGGALATIPEQAALGAGGEALKQTGVGEGNLNLHEIGEAAAGGAVGALPFAGVHALGNARGSVKNVTDSAGQLLDRAKTRVSEGLQGAKETAQETFGEGGPVRQGASTAAEGLRKAMDTAKSEVDKVAEGIPLVDPAELASATGEKLNHLIRGADGKRTERAKQWLDEMLTDNGLPPERRQELMQAGKELGTEAGDLAVAVAKKAWDKTKAEATRAKDWLDSLQGSKEPPTNVKKSEDYSGLNQTIKDVIMPALKERHGDTLNAETINNVGASVRHVLQDLMKTGRVDAKNHDMLVHFLGDDGARTALQELHGHVADASDKHSESKLYEALNGMADESTSRRGRLELLRKSAVDENVTDQHLREADRIIQDYITRPKHDELPAKREYEERAFRERMNEAFGKNADRVLSSYEKFSGDNARPDERTGRTLDADEQVDAEGFGPDALSDRKVEAVALMNKPKKPEGWKKGDREPVARPRPVDREWARAKIEEVEAKNPDMKARFVTADEYRKIFGQDPHDPSSPPPEGKGYIVMEKFEPKDHYDDKTISSLRYDTNKGDRRTDKRALRTNPDAPDSDIIDAAKLTRQHRLEPGTQDLTGPQRDARAFMTGVARLQEHFGRRFDIPDDTIINEHGMTYADAKRVDMSGLKKSFGERATSLRLKAEAVDDPVEKAALKQRADLLEKFGERQKARELSGNLEELSKGDLTKRISDTLQDIDEAEQAVKETIEGWKKDHTKFDKNDVKNLYEEYSGELRRNLDELNYEADRRERGSAEERVLGTHTGAGIPDLYKVARREIDAVMKRISDEIGVDPDNALFPGSRTEARRNKLMELQDQLLALHPGAEENKGTGPGMWLRKGLAVVNKFEAYLDSLPAKTPEERQRLADGRAKANAMEARLKELKARDEASMKSADTDSGRRNLDPRGEIHEAEMLGSDARVTKDLAGDSLYKSTRPTYESMKGLLDSKIARLESGLAVVDGKYDYKEGKKGYKVSKPAQALGARAREIFNHFEDLSKLDKAAMLGITRAKSASEVAETINGLYAKLSKAGELKPAPAKTEKPKGPRTWAENGKPMFSGERPKGASADARDPNNANSSMSARRGSEGVRENFKTKSDEARSRMNAAAEALGEPPDPKVVAAKKAALVEKARSGDPELLKHLSESDDAKGLQRAVEHLLKHEGTEKAIDAANKRLGELVRNDDTAYGMQTKKYSLLSTEMHERSGRVGFAATHDSPHRVTEFNWRENLGKGEGNQAFGVGTYLSTADGVHKYYKAMMTNHPDRDKTGLGASKSPTYHVTVELDPKRLLNWDKPLSEQSASVRLRMLKAIKDNDLSFMHEELGAETPGRYDLVKTDPNKATGEQLYKALAEKLGSQRAASEYLQSLGIPGHEYAAAAGRNEKAPNYVIYDDSKIKTNYVHFDQSKAQPGGRAQTQAEQVAVDVHIKTVLGPSVKVAFENIFHAGEFERMKFGDVIRLSVHSLDPMSVAHHESLHAFFAQLRDAGATDVMGVLHKAADGASVRKQLEKLLANEPDALKQLKDSEERVAYMYQYWNKRDANGERMLRVGPETKSMLGKIADFFRQVLGIWSNDERALHIMERFQAGDWNADRSAFARSVMETHTNKTLDSITKPLSNLATQMAVSGGAALQDSGIQALRTLGEMAKGKLHAEGDDPGFIPAARVERARVMNELSRSLGNLNVTEAHMAEALADLQGRKPASSLEARLAVRTTRKVLDDMLKYMQSAGVNIDKIKGSQYFPRVYDADYITRHAKDFRTVLEKNGLTPAEANRVMLKIINADGNEFQIETLRPGDQHAKQRTLAHIPDRELERFMSKDYHQIMNSYITQGTRRAEWARRFGDDNAKANALLREAREQGATQEQIEHAEKFIRGVNGTLGDDINPTLRRLQGNMIVYQNVRLLPLAVFSMAIDPMGLVVRGGTIRDALHAYKRGFMESVKSFQDNPSKDAMTSLAETLGVIDDAVLQHTLGTSFSQGMVGNTGRKINDTFFRYNLVEQANRSMRVAATAAALKFLERHADGTADAHSKRWLSELGLQPNEVQMKNGRVALTEADGLTPAQALKMRLAVNKWVDGAVLRPDAVDKPVWMNDPHFALIAHLKQFVFSFHETVLKRVAHEAEHGNYKPAMALASYVPIMIAADLAKGVIQGGGSQPDWKDKWGAEDYVWSGVQRAGLLGVGQFAVDAASGRAAGLLGPTIEQFTDAAAVLEGRAAFRPFLLKSMPANALYAAAAGGTATDPTFAD